MKFDHEHIKFVDNGWMIGGYYISTIHSKPEYKKYVDAIEKILIEGECMETLCFSGWRTLTFNEGRIFYFTPSTPSQYNSVLDALNIATSKYDFQVEILTSDRMTMQDPVKSKKFQFVIKGTDLLKVFTEAEIASYNLNIL